MTSRPQEPVLVLAMASKNCPSASLMSVPWHEFRTTASSRCSTVMRRSVGRSPVASTWAMTASANRLRQVASSGCAAKSGPSCPRPSTSSADDDSCAGKGRSRSAATARRRRPMSRPTSFGTGGSSPSHVGACATSLVGITRSSLCSGSASTMRHVIPAMTKRAMRPSSSSPLSLRVNTKASSTDPIVRRVTASRTR